MEQILSQGAMEQMIMGKKPPNPVLQIIGYKPMAPDQTANELRYRLMVGDGLNAHQYCVITNQELVEDIRSGRLEKWSIVRVTSYHSVEYGEGPPDPKRRIIYLLNLEVLKRGSEVGQKLTCQPSNQVPLQQQQQPPAFQQPAHQQSYQSPQQPSFQQPLTQPQPYNHITSPRSIRDNHHDQTIAIGELTPYIGKWSVKGRVTSKSAIREYTNAKGAGKLFNFTLADKSGEIKVTAFNTDCERVFGYVEPNKVYRLSRGSVKNADKRYTTAEFEITLNSDSLIEEVRDSREADDVPMAKFNFVSIGSLTNIVQNQPVDLIGAITAIGEAETIISRTKNKELRKRNITIVDMSRHSVSVTLWGQQADIFVGCEGDVFVSKAARVGNYGGVSVSAGDCVFINPDIPEVRKMKNWYANLLERNFTCLTNSQDVKGGTDQWKTINEMLDLEQARNIESSGQQSAAYAKCKAILLAVGKNPVYKCCPTDKCGKKLVDTQSGELKCEKCQQTYTNYKIRFKTDVEIGDLTASSWITLWDEKAESILGLKPEELEKCMRMENRDLYEKILTGPTFLPFIFTLRARVDKYNQEERVKLNVISMSPCETVTYGKKLIEDIKKMAAM